MKLRSTIAALHAALLAILLAASPALAGSMTLLGAGKASAGGGGSTTAWDPTKANVGISLSNSNLTATQTAASPSSEPFLAVAGHSTGKFYYEIVVSVSGAGISNDSIGIGNASANLTLFTGSGDNNSIGATGGGTVLLNGAGAGTVSTYAVGNTLCIAVDMGNTKIWWRTNGGNWNNDILANQNPATNTGGVSFATMNAGPWFPMANTSANSDVMTANFGATAYAQTPPSGFGNW